MLKPKSLTGNLPQLSELSQRLGNKTLMVSSQQMGWNGILVEQYQNLPVSVETELPTLSSHWLILPLGHPGRLIQRSGNRPQESIFQKGDSLLIPARQSSSWRCQEGKSCQTELHIHVQPELIKQVAQASEINTEQLDLVYRFAKQDLQLQHIAMLLLAELRSDGMMGQLYGESLSQALVIHLLRHYSEVIQIITPENRNLTHIQLQQVIDYIHTHLNRDLSLGELASVINISPTYFANLFKQAMGISPHQYVIQQRVKRAEVMLKRTDLAIADIALQVGFSSQSHLTQHFKRFTGMTPKQVR
jgi:AraC family transcriptional regulator